MLQSISDNHVHVSVCVLGGLLLTSVLCGNNGGKRHKTTTETHDDLTTSQTNGLQSQLELLPSATTQESVVTANKASQASPNDGTTVTYFVPSIAHQSAPIKELEELKATVEELQRSLKAKTDECISLERVKSLDAMKLGAALISTANAVNDKLLSEFDNFSASHIDSAVTANTNHEDFIRINSNLLAEGEKMKAEYKAQLVNLSENLEVAMKELSLLRVEKSSLEGSRSLLERDNISLKIELSSCENKMLLLLENAKSTSETISRHDVSTELVTENAFLKNQLLLCEELQANGSKEIVELEEVVDGLEKELAASKEALTSAKEIADIATKLKDSSKDDSAEILKFRNLLGTCRSELAKSQEEFMAMKKDRDEAFEKLKYLKNSSSLCLTCGELRHSLEETQAELKSFCVENSELSEKLLSALSDISKLHNPEQH